jgi:hypothetical protein
MSGTCAWCGQRGPLQGHHVTGRAVPAGAYLDPGFTVEICKQCHDLEHQALRRARLAFASGPTLRHRLLRAASFLNRLVDAGRLPAWVAAVAGLLAEAADALADETSEVAT